MIRFDRQAVCVYVAGRRLHHGAVGACLAAIGVALALHDRADVREWIPRR